MNENYICSDGHEIEIKAYLLMLVGLSPFAYVCAYTQNDSFCPPDRRAL